MRSRRTGSPGSARGTPRLVVAAAVAAAVVSVSGDRVAAYVFYDRRAQDYIVGSDQALRWSVDTWPPGETLEWHIEDGSHWAALPDLSAEDFAPPIDEALSDWSEIPTADISWRVAGVVEPSEESRFGDSRNVVFLDADYRYPTAVLWWIRSATTRTWALTECDIAASHRDFERAAEWEWEADDLKANLEWDLRRPLADCLGLGPRQPSPATFSVRTSPAEDDTEWVGSRALGNYRDEHVGASLLRPRADWSSEVGTLAGRVEADGLPLSFVSVWAVRSRGGSLIGAFSNAAGDFLIEGLEPDDYFLWAHPIRGKRDYAALIQAGAAMEVKDVVSVHPVRVEAGRATAGVRITMRRGRE